MPTAVVEGNYDIPLAARGGSGSYMWSLASEPAPPSWLKLDGSRLTATVPPAALDDKPTKEYPLTVTVTDGSPGRKPQVKKVVLSVMARPITVDHPNNPGAKLRITTDPELPFAFEGIPYRLSLAAQGGLPPYHWEVAELRFREVDATESKPIRSSAIGN